MLYPHVTNSKLCAECHPFLLAEVFGVVFFHIAKDFEGSVCLATFL